MYTVQGCPTKHDLCTLYRGVPLNMIHVQCTLYTGVQLNKIYVHCTLYRSVPLYIIYVHRTLYSGVPLNMIILRMGVFKRFAFFINTPLMIAFQNLKSRPFFGVTLYYIFFFIFRIVQLKIEHIKFLS